MIQPFNSSRVQHIARRLSVYCSVLAAMLLTLLTTAASAQLACNVGYTITNQWQGGFGTALTISNTGTTAINGWSLTWTFANGQTIPSGSLWNGNITQNGANVTVTNLSYDGAIPAGGSLASVGFNGTWNNVANTIPANFALNGVPCNGVKTQSFTLEATPSSVTLSPSGSVTDSIQINGMNGFSGSVNLTATGLPTGVTPAFVPNPATATSILTLTASATAPATTTPAMVTINGISGTLSASTTIAVSVSGGTCIPTAITPYLQVNGGAWQQASTASVPAAATVNLGPQPISGTWSWTGPNGFTSNMRQLNAIALTAGVNTYTATYTNAAKCPSTQPFNITEAGGSFTLAPASPTVTVVQGNSGTDLLTITDFAPFTGSVTLTATGQPTGVAVGFGTNPATTNSLATFTVASSVPVGSYPITIHGVSGSSSATTIITLIVTQAPPSGFSLSASPVILPIPQCGSNTDVITVKDIGTFTGTVTLVTSGLPTNVTLGYNPNPTATNSTLTFTVGCAVPVGSYPITITGTSGTLAQVAITITLEVTPETTTGCTGTLCILYKGYFQELYAGIHNASNGYFSPQGVPYHSVETLIVEAPDYGHETVSETYSYYIWLEALEGNFLGNYSSMQTAWNSFAANMIPTAYQPTASGYTPGTPATYGPTWDSPSDYPSQLNASVPVGQDPIANELHTTYNTWEIYGAHWIIDSDNWYGYGQQEDGTSKPSCLNSYQRGPQESVWLTVPQPCWDNFKWGDTSNGGYLSLFTSGPYTPQWKYTDAPDADARAIQAVYWAQQYASTQGAAAVSQVATLTPLASELGDYLRYSFFDKYFKVQGCQSLNCAGDTGKKESSAYLLSWYYAWGGALPADGNWAWRIGSSDVHFGYQNPLAAYALTTTLAPASPTAKTDWTTGLERQLEFYRWLQSSNGAIAGGATNSWGGGSNADETAWGGQYAVPPANTPTFYGMSYIAEPSYDNPPSNQWFGFQAWSMERVAEYYYVTGDPKAKIILDPWIAWAEANTSTSGTAYSIPSSLLWSGQPALNWNATTQNWTPGTAFNAGLTVSITAFSQDVGVTGSLCKALLYYSAGTKQWTGAQDMPSYNLAVTLLNDVWANDRDAIGLSAPETGTTYNQFDTPIYIPAGWTGVMPDGDPINSSSTFLSIRSKYKLDPAYPAVAAYVAGTGPAPIFHFHRFWAQVDIASAYAIFANLFPND
jgi:hypothetical protein